MITQVNPKTILEYVWIGGKGEIRSKTRVIHKIISDVSMVPIWNYDGSSTEQATSNGITEVILKPCLLVKDPLRRHQPQLCNCYVVLCDTYDENDVPLKTNKRHDANNMFNKNIEEEPWFGLEQEYFFIHPENKEKNKDYGNLYYCGIVYDKNERIIVEKHMEACLYCNLSISGMNAEVVPSQWEFQIGPCLGIRAGDELILARFFLEKIAENYNVRISYLPKPFNNQNGSGCHINFSTNKMRSEDGIKIIKSCMLKLEKRITEHLSVYGNDNNKRLTGEHETSSIDTFSWGIGTRNTSIRIGTQTEKDGYGYFEDRRPAANIDPYSATCVIFETCCMQEIMEANDKTELPIVNNINTSLSKFFSV